MIIQTFLENWNEQRALAKKLKEEKEKQEAETKQKIKEAIQEHKDAIAKEVDSEQAQKDAFDKLFNKP